MFTLILFVLSCVYVEALRLADPPSKESYQLYIALKIEQAAKAQKKGCRAVNNNNNNFEKRTDQGY
jgi:hypothetical protein